MEKIKVIGDLKVTETTGGNDKHGGFWHQLAGCHCVRSTTETILCSPPIETTESYYKCGFWRKVRYEKVKDAQ